MLLSMVAEKVLKRARLEFYMLLLCLTSLLVALETVADTLGDEGGDHLQ